MNPNWDDCKNAFHIDGSWRDLYVLGSDCAMWSRVVQSLAENFECQFWQGDSAKECSPIPDCFDIGPSDDMHTMHVVFPWGTVNSHFFTDDEIEFDIDPREVQSADSFEQLLGVIRVIGNSAGQPVLMTEENSRDSVWLKFLPDSGCFEQGGMF